MRTLSGSLWRQISLAAAIAILGLIFSHLVFYHSFGGLGERILAFNIVAAAIPAEKADS